MSEIDLKGLDKADVLRALYDNARAQGLGFLHFTPEKMGREEAEALLKQTTYFDYVKGRVMKVDLRTDSLDPWLYDRDNGQGAAEAVISELRRAATSAASAERSDAPKEVSSPLRAGGKEEA